MSSEEESARGVLLDMQRKLVDSPYAAFSVPSHATHADIRAAFLKLTKRFHPAKFGRMSPDIQKLANEVFLALKEVYEGLVKPHGGSPRKPPSSKIPTSRPLTRPLGVPITSPGTRAPTPPRGTRAPTPPRGTRTPTPPSGIRSPTPPSGHRALTPPSGIRISGHTPTSSRSDQTQPQTRSAPLRTPPATGSPHPSSSSRHTTPTSGVRIRPTPPPGAPQLDRELATLLAQIERGEWDQAQRTIDHLVARNPQSRRYQAMAAYTRGRRAQTERRLDDARVELQQALMIDPDLAVAKTALGELFARRR